MKRRRPPWSSSREEQDRRRLHALADLGPEEPQPHRRGQAGVEGEECTFGAAPSRRSVAQTCQPRRLRTANVPSRTPIPRIRTPTTVRTARHPNPVAVAAGTASSARTTAPGRVSAPSTARPSTSTPAAADASGRSDITIDATPCASTQRLLRGGRSGGQGGLALLTRSAGEPDQRWRGGTTLLTAEPARTSRHDRSSCPAGGRSARRPSPRGRP